MSTAVHHRLLLPLLLIASTLTRSLVLAQNNTNTTVPCPLNFSILRQRVASSDLPSTVDPSQNCQYIRQGLRLVQSDYLQRTNNFLPPLSAAESCWRSYQRFADDFLPNFDIRSSCGFRTSWISQGCVNLTTRSDFESRIVRSSLDDVVSNCNQSLENRAPCAGCVASLSRIQGLYFTGPSVGNVSTCSDYPSIYAAAFVNFLGPTDLGTDKCLFLLDFTSNNRKGKKSKALIPAVSAACGVVLLLLLVIGGFCLARKRKRTKKKRKKTEEEKLEMGLDAGLVKFDYEEIKTATNNFSVDNIVGRGGFGNVYRGKMIDGSEVAVKRFKNCSASGDESFAHEVGVIGSIRHVNLVALKGYCIATAPTVDGHQRMIICELMNNGSLHDHLFGGAAKSKLSWPIRQKIALGTARGLAYLHTGAQPTIIHRDIKASNILLDDEFEAKLADFGLAKSNPEGMTHLSTRVAGTWGYLAPEYALYGQLTERSDVYSYGVVLLELLSGKKALIRQDGGGGDGSQSQPYLLADMAWSLAKEGRAIDLVEEGMPEKGEGDVLERYIMVGVLCSHPEMQARPTMEQVVKMLESEEISIPAIPNRPMFVMGGGGDDVEMSIDSMGFSSSGYHQPYGFKTDAGGGHKDGETDSGTSGSP
ncbi:Probable LRR receptor-like serine/threonine-protein kinase RKF3 [Linum grandiflorum]